MEADSLIDRQRAGFRRVLRIPWITFAKRARVVLSVRRKGRAKEGAFSPARWMVCRATFEEM